MSCGTFHEWLIEGREPSPPCKLTDGELKELGERLMAQIRPRSFEEQVAILMGGPNA